MSHRTRVKICGVTLPQDARAAAIAGADAVGVVLHAASARGIPVDTARRIAVELPPFVQLVGLFVDESPDRIREIARTVPFDLIQLHGDESPDFAKGLSPLRVIKAVTVEAGKLTDILRPWKGADLAGIVLDTGGGTGIVNDWEEIVRCQTSGGFEGLPPIIIAGGLTPETVGAVVRLIHPWGVDVSSGVEITKGIKSDEKMAAFVKEVAAA